MRTCSSLCLGGSPHHQRHLLSTATALTSLLSGVILVSLSLGTHITCCGIAGTRSLWKQLKAKRLLRAHSFKTVQPMVPWLHVFGQQESVVEAAFLIGRWIMYPKDPPASPQILRFLSHTGSLSQCEKSRLRHQGMAQNSLCPICRSAPSVCHHCGPTKCAQKILALVWLLPHRECLQSQGDQAEALSSRLFTASLYRRPISTQHCR